MCLERSVLPGRRLERKAGKAWRHRLQQEAVDRARRQQAHQRVALLAIADRNSDQSLFTRVQMIGDAPQGRFSQCDIRDQHCALP